MIIINNESVDTRVGAVEHRYNGQILAVVAIFTLLATLIVFTAQGHIHHADEAQAWLLARDTGLVSLLTERMRYEGSPGLWHLLLKCVQAAGLQYDQLWLVSTIPALLTIGLILYRSPFPLVLRVGFSTSYFFAYQFGVVGRSYVLSALIIVLIATTYESRFRRPVLHGVLIGLLAQTNAHAFIVAAAVGGDWLLDCWRRRVRLDRSLLAGIAIALLSAALALAQAWPTADNGFFDNMERGSGALLQLLSNAFVYQLHLAHFGARAFDPETIRAAGLISLALVLPFAIILLRRGDAVFGLSLAGLMSMALLFHAVRHHASVLFLAWMLALWIRWQDLGTARRWLSIVVGLVLAGSSWTTLLSMASETTCPYSPSRDGAAMLAAYQAARPGLKIAAIGYKSIALLPYRPDNPFINHTTRHGSYYGWDATPGITTKQGADQIRQTVARYPEADLYVLVRDGTNKTAEADAALDAAGLRPIAEAKGCNTFRGARFSDDLVFLTRDRQTSQPSAAP